MAGGHPRMAHGWMAEGYGRMADGRTRPPCCHKPFTIAISDKPSAMSMSASGLHPHRQRLGELERERRAAAKVHFLAALIHDHRGARAASSGAADDRAL